MASRPAGLLLTALLLLGPSLARAGDLDASSDLLALAYLGDRLLDNCDFAPDGHGNAIRVTADYYRERIEDFVLDPLGQAEAETVAHDAQVKAERLLERVVAGNTGTTPPQSVAAWCADKGEAVIETIARLFRAREQEAQQKLVAAKQ